MREGGTRHRSGIVAAAALTCALCLWITGIGTLETGLALYKRFVRGASADMAASPPVGVNGVMIIPCFLALCVVFLFLIRGRCGVRGIVAAIGLVPLWAMVLWGLVDAWQTRILENVIPGGVRDARNMMAAMFMLIVHSITSLGVWTRVRRLRDEAEEEC